MRIFNRDGKTNFVDDNNVMLGYDTEQDYCENAGWFIAESPQLVLPDLDIESNLPFTQPNPLPDLDAWRFDIDYFMQVKGGDMDGGGIVIFRLKRLDGNAVCYLHLYNVHNGYYGHGFTFTDHTFKVKYGYV